MPIEEPSQSVALYKKIKPEGLQITRPGHLRGIGKRLEVPELADDVAIDDLRIHTPRISMVPPLTNAVDIPKVKLIRVKGKVQLLSTTILMLFAYVFRDSFLGNEVA